MVGSRAVEVAEDGPDALHPTSKPCVPRSAPRDNPVAMRIFSGIQPTGSKHFGNYSGGFRQYAATQELGDAFFCIVDLHSITVEYDPADLRERTLDLAAMLFATGLDPERSTVFAQSGVAAHAEAAWLLSSVASFGELRRMTQFKDKSERHDFVSAGLFTYPVLMAGDILLYQTDVVPVGDDQRQHIELAEHRRALQQPVRRDLQAPEGSSRKRGPDQEPPGARARDVDDARRRAGSGAAGRRTGRDPEEVQDRGHRFGPGGSARSGRSPGSRT